MATSDKIVFLGINSYINIETNWHTEFNFWTFFRLAMGAIMTEFEFFTCLYIAGVILAFGGIYGVVIITLMIFIRIEERQGKFS